MAAEARLITIPISHFCEKARWALDRAGIPFREERHLQGIHIAAVKRAGGGRTAPVLVTPDGTSVADSSDILAWVDERTESERRLYPEGPLGDEARALEEDFDERLGPDGRRWMYSRTADEREMIVRFNGAGVPRWQRRALPFALPVMIPFINRYLDITPATVETSLETVRGTFEDVAERLGDGRRYLLGDRFTAADLAFAALAAAMVWPPEYGSPLPEPGDVGEGLAAEVEAYRAHPAGAYALRLFREER